MLKDELLFLCHEELIKLGGVIAEDKPEILRALADKIKSEYGIDIEFSTLNRGSETYITYKFHDSRMNVCKSAFAITTDNVADTFIENMIYVIDGCSAISYLNKAEDKYRADMGSIIDIHYQWGRTKYCSIGSWDYNKITIKLSADALNSLIELYSSSESAYSMQISSKMNESDLGKRNVIEFVKAFNTIPIHKFIGARLADEPIDKLLGQNMLGPDDAKRICKSNYGAKGVQSLIVMNTLSQLGIFVVLSKWRIDYDDKSISISLLEDKAIDLDSSSIVSNYALTSRIEQAIKLKDSEIAELFNN